MSADKEDKKFLPKVTIPYSPTLFRDKMPLLLISFKGIPLPVQALVDSGATNSLLNIDIANRLRLKIDYSKKTVGTGVGGGFEYVTAAPFGVGIMGQKYEIQFNIPLDENLVWPCILGHDSIFKFSKIIFKTYKKEFDIFFRADIN